jgi:ribosomal protein S18 acetylase RimI-like enzyme
MAAPVQIRRGGAEDVDRLQQLWVSVHHVHAESMPELAPYVDDATTWAERRQLYAELLAKPDTVLLLASAGDALVGYGLAHVMPVEETWVPDTWVTGPRIGEIESLAVLPEHRGRGLGTELLDRLERELREQGVADVVIGVLPGNEGAVRMYERRGYWPTWMYLSRFESR